MTAWVVTVTGGAVGYVGVMARDAPQAAERARTFAAEIAGCDVEHVRWDHHEPVVAHADGFLWAAVDATGERPALTDYGLPAPTRPQSAQS